ncbi:peptidoglycan glycosyltransferase [Cryomorpha ignava]|uniref:Peptidoglycan glycosyltransferase n=1 Tax=Cryomorpha ignava TaxID=101383 RepID=A0A7K3WR79_9FLAO|nr:transglycosylase domain-containing protein [Cryomorpha ignava]NEN24183.1 peptidoglycan glycosyltransferase [Cryomorpha ignava]
MASKKSTSKKSVSKKKSNPKKKKQQKPIWKKIVRLSIYAIILGAVLLFALFGSVYIGLFGKLPTAEDLKDIKNDNASEVFSSDGVVLGKYFVQNRSSVSYDDIPKVVINALVATEDSRFFEHEGIDFYSIPRVVIKTAILGDRTGGGGSTISQQLVKNLFGRQNYGALSMPVNKLKENITALKLEETYNKEEIITLYLNTVSFGENVYGIKAAGQRFFGKNPEQLSTEEAATLIGMLKANTSYNPRLHPEKSKERRNTVLALMAQQGDIEPDKLQELLEKPLTLDYQKMEGQFGSAPYLRAMIEGELNEILSKTQKENNEPYSLYSDGLRIEISINSILQAEAEKSVRQNMKKLQESFDQHWKGKEPWAKYRDFIWNEAKKSERYKRLAAAKKTEAEIKANFNQKTKLLVFSYDGLKPVEMTPMDSVAYHQMILQTGFLAMDSHTGDVLAYVGGIDFGYFPYDHVYGKRQVGSTFKPFVYTAALEAGIKPCDYIDNEQLIFSNYDDWSPENADGKYGGYYSVKGGLTYSVNTVAARLISQTGPEPVRRLAARAGIESYLPKGPSIALGVADISLFEMVRAYTMFGNEGKSTKPVFIKRIKAANGDVLYEAKQAKAKPVLDLYTAHAMRSMLEMAVDSGTARSIRSRFNVRTPLGGKTGTTQNNADGWFMALSPRVVCGAWVGGQSPVVRFRSTALGQGAATALPIVATWLKNVETNKDVPNILGRSFPENSIDLELDLLCPLFIESRTENFLENLFDNDRKQERREIKAKRDSSSSGAEEDDEGWIRKLFDKLKKD